tara:strand:- start:192 stop:338 length:147 start_codon:yes stop_codon:yes gene_type:complete
MISNNTGGCCGGIGGIGGIGGLCVSVLYIISYIESADGATRIRGEPIG